MDVHKAYLLIIYIFITTASFGAPADKSTCSPYSMKYQGIDARRIWLASYLPIAAQEQLVAVQNQLKSLGLNAGYYERANRLHITMLPIGSIMGINNPEPADAVAQALSEVSFSPALVKIKKIEVLTTFSGIPRLVWAVLESPGLVTLQHKIQNALEKFCDIEKQRFTAHVTLYRFGQSESKKALSPKLIQKINNINISDAPNFYIDVFNLLETGKKFKDDYVVLKEYKSEEPTPCLACPIYYNKILYEE